jgi:transcriptional regulator with XRE-family HTH domain
MAESNKIGGRLASLREERKLASKDLASRAGIPVEELAAIESGLVSPSIAPLVKLTRTLGVRLGTLLDDVGGEGPIVSRAGVASEVMRAPGRLSPNEGAMSFFSLAQGKAGRSMEPFIVDIRPGSAPPPELSVHEGEEFIYVLTGSIELSYGSESIALGAGDSVYYDSLVPHRVSAGASARVLAVIYAPF